MRKASILAALFLNAPLSAQTVRAPALKPPALPASALPAAVPAQASPLPAPLEAPPAVVVGAALKELLPPNPFVLPADKVAEIAQKLNVTAEQLLQPLAELIKENARPPISNYFVGSAGLGGSGGIYLGVNLEFAGLPLHQTVHGEQFVVANAAQHGETSLQKIATSGSGPPCGHCLQFLNELGNGDKLTVVDGQKRTPLTSFLPDSFGPGSLGIAGSPLSARDNGLPSKPSDSPLLTAALKAANASWAPYSKSYSGVALKTKHGKIYAGSYLENAAFNPSLSPLQSALAALAADLRASDEIVEAVLVEKAGAPVSQAQSAKDLLASIAPGASLLVERR